jgi:DNA/RNA endonuclease G (NUC1)
MLCRVRLSAAKDAEKRPSIDFKVDPAVKTGTATREDYTNSGYDRGHLAPCRNLQWSYKTMTALMLPHYGTLT